MIQRRFTYFIAIFLPLLIISGRAEATSPNVCPDLEKMLGRIEKVGHDLKTFQADMVYEQLNGLQDTMNKRNGKLYYKVTEKTVFFRVHFADFLQVDLDDEDSKTKPTKFDEDLAFDGMWFTRRNAKTKHLSREQLSLKPKGKDQYELGKTPFPVPSSLKKADVLKNFNVELVKPNPKAPKNLKNTDHLKLVPKKDSPYKKEFVQMNLWFDKKTSMLTQISQEKEGLEIMTVTWTNIKTNKGISDKTFKLKKGLIGWTVETKPYKNN